MVMPYSIIVQSHAGFSSPFRSQSCGTGCYRADAPVLLSDVQAAFSSAHARVVDGTVGTGYWYFLHVGCKIWPLRGKSDPIRSKKSKRREPRVEEHMMKMRTLSQLRDICSYMYLYQVPGATS